MILHPRIALVVCRGTHLVRNAQVTLSCGHLRLVHLDRLGSRTLRLIHDLNLAFADLDGVVRVVVLGVADSDLLITGHRR